MINILFFGSTTDSVTVLEALHSSPDLKITVAAVVTQPPRPIGRKQILTPTPVETWATHQQVPCFSFLTHPLKSYLYNDEAEVIQTLNSVPYDLIVSASFGQLIPWEIISSATYGAINVHPSLLPRWRGADPTPWTILAGDEQTGVTLVGLSKTFDEGKLFAQQIISTPNTINHQELREQLFTHGGQLLVDSLPDILSGNNQGKPQDPHLACYARRLTRNDGFISWPILQKAQAGEKIFFEELPPIHHACQKALLRTSTPPLDTSNTIQRLHCQILALSPWPGSWTTITIKGQEKRMKILHTHLDSEDQTQPRLVLDEVQLEGKTPQAWNHISELITT